jgi:hypothetical protein
MELELIRSYNSEGTNGELIVKVCNTIELPWLQNNRNISCIPEGRYEVKKRFTKKHQLHFLIVDVPGRNGILIHPANDALTELRGCIAPVTSLTGLGKGSQSRLANEKLKAILMTALERKEKVFLNIKSQS